MDINQIFLEVNVSYAQMVAISVISISNADVNLEEKLILIKILALIVLLIIVISAHKTIFANNVQEI